MERSVRTQDRVFEAAETLLRSGQKVSFTNVRQLLSKDTDRRPSSTTVQKALDAWWKHLADRFHKIEARPQVPAAVADLANTLWDQALASAEDSLANHKKRVEVKLVDTESALETALEEKEAAIGLGDTYKSALEQAEKQLHHLEALLGVEQARREEAEKRIGDTQDGVHGVRSEAAKQQKKLEERLETERQRADAKELLLLQQIGDWKQAHNETKQMLAKARDDWKSTRDALNARVNDLNTANQELRSLLAERASKIKLLERDLENLRNDNESLERQVDQANAAAEKRLEKLTQTIAERDKQCERLRADIAKSREVQAALRVERDKLIAENDRLQKETASSVPAMRKKALGKMGSEQKL